jgi:hypothetical protein
MYNINQVLLHMKLVQGINYTKMKEKIETMYNLTRLSMKHQSNKDKSSLLSSWFLYFQACS